MRSGTLPRLLLVGDTFGDSLRTSLEQCGLPIASTPLSGIPLDQIRQAGLLLVGVTAKNMTSAQGVCRRWRIELGDQHIPILWLCESGSPGFYAGGLDAGADVCLPDSTPAELLVSQIRALLRVQHLNQRLLMRAGEATQINQRLQSAYQQMDSDLELTRRIHRGFLPRSLPEAGNVRMAVCYRPRSRIGGDFYDAFRLDEDHVGLFVADAMGRGLPASSLLSIFIKRCLQGKEVTGNSYRLIPPGEVLAKLNRDLVSLGLTESPFVTMVYIQLNVRNGSMTLARAAHPYPLYLPVRGKPTWLTSTGPLLGVFESEFSELSYQLSPGDKLLLTSDGVAPGDVRGDGTESSMDRLAEVAGRYRELPIATLVDQVAREMLEVSRQQEDFTILGLELVGG